MWSAKKCHAQSRGPLRSGLRETTEEEEKEEAARSALYEIATGIITYFLHGSSRSLIRTTVLRAKAKCSGERERGDGKGEQKEDRDKK